MHSPDIHDCTKHTEKGEDNSLLMSVHVSNGRCSPDSCHASTKPSSKQRCTSTLLAIGLTCKRGKVRRKCLTVSCLKRAVSLSSKRRVQGALLATHEHRWSSSPSLSSSLIPRAFQVLPHSSQIAVNLFQFITPLYSGGQQTRYFRAGCINNSISTRGFPVRHPRLYFLF